MKKRLLASAFAACLAAPSLVLAVPCSDPASGVFLSDGTLDGTVASSSVHLSCAEPVTVVTNDSETIINTVDFNNYPSPYSLNTDYITTGAFGQTDWDELDKIEYDYSKDPHIIDDPLPAYFAGGDFVGVRGWFTLASGLWSSFDNLLVVLKDGNLGPGATTWSAYLLTPDQYNYEWIFGGSPLKNISHIDLYGTHAPVPEPATMLLFGTGLAGLAAVARRRKN